jgi:hypothetical protein
LLNRVAVDILAKTGSRSSIGIGDPAKSPGNQRQFGPGGHLVDTSVSPNDANGHLTASVDAQLARVVQAWNRVPKAMRAGIVAMIEAATET